MVMCGRLENRKEFPELEAILLDPGRIGLRAWNKFVPGQLYPPDAWRLRQQRAVVLHSHFGYVALDDMRYAKTLDMPWLVSFYGADVYMLGRDSKYVCACQPVFERAARVLSMGPAMSTALEAMGCPADKLAIHTLGVDAVGLAHQPRVRLPTEPLRLLFAATFREKKGARYLIEAADILRRRGVPLSLTLVGDSAGLPGDEESKAELFALIGRLGLDTLTTHHSWVPFEELVKLGLAAHVFVVPSITATSGDSEGSPFVMAQMMATGMPTVATRHSDIPYTFGPYANRLVPERDPLAIADRLQRYYDQPDTMTREGLEYRAHILATFDTRICAGALSSVYDSL